ncbi:MAG TPA: bifunctional 2-polyprenyl-6-hydroxyphenol methylase/3-demethylubiquinol 3-O-methyltransferase UbiG [Pseudomonas sp.]|uniref:bifunctional 2-polyprenyl-6-hydroxyphenol methylase/3-demethylubiquinol 3-O-methyltransferase UbiG n=1 Tax=Pseudomonas sp. TaxID=306 RepID=UPI002D173FEC|nr:bifunctional 2-polyprenyl-6-hydroxyphenol methylase/3-demethylubiquinol 3-O-methyltransferase UbiG [Pseudomonas sp.]HSX89291.1 bifunctional 2-polyprenyl-6-hydroxyphenol methylase/3-demethylubiquinol 3-O-methyltransferase UbiG [Pseudomonas sp.]
MANIDNDIYNRVAPTWWDEDGFMAILRTSLNPPRAAYFRNVIVQRMGLQPSGLQVLDVGCGGGLLSEEFAALGCQVTGIDPSEPTLQAAREHARKGGLNIRYLSGRGEALPFEDRSFDLVCCCDVFEHVEDLDAVLREIGRVLKPGGVLLFDTINRTRRSKLVAIKLAQDWPPTRFIPADVHVWEKFIRPQELQERMQNQGLVGCEFAGLSPRLNPFGLLLALWRTKLGRMPFAELGRRLRLRESRDLSISYMGFAVRSLA